MQRLINQKCIQTLNLLFGLTINQLVFAGNELADSEQLAQISNNQALRTDETFCQRAQQLMVGSQLVSSNVVHQDFEAYVDSKASSAPLITHQYVNRWLDEATEVSIPVSVSCKLKTAERINHDFADKIGSDVSLRAITERSCQFINQQTLQRVLKHNSAISAAEANSKFVFDEDDNKFIGPFWLRPWPYQVAYQDDMGVTHIRSKALHVEYSAFIPMPASFKGVHYCHLISPEYLSALLRDEMVAPKLP